MRRSLGLVLVVSVVIAACGSGGSTPSSGSGTSSGPSQAGTAATQAATKAPADGASSAPTQAMTPTQAPMQTGDTGDSCGLGTYLTYDTRTFCGPAKATVKLGTDTYELTQGECMEDSTLGFVVNLGTTVIGGQDLPKDAPLYFAIVINDDGATATGLLGGSGFAVIEAAVELGADRQSGTVTGTDIEGRALEVSFSCR